MKDYYATLKIQHGRLKAAMLKLGINTYAELSRLSGVHQCRISELVNFRKLPCAPSGKWHKSTLAICKALGYPPSEIFPKHLQREIPTNRIAAYVENAQLCGGGFSQMDPGQECENNERSRVIDEILNGLTKRERSVIKARFWEGKGLKECGDEHGLSGTRVMQIEMKALKRLRLPFRKEKLEALS
jgi:lambda repressor-like predicted transcriptional regulator